MMRTMEMMPPMDPKDIKTQSYTRNKNPESLKTPEANVLPRTADGRYECVKNLGEGGFGVVYRAERIYTDKDGKERMREPVVIKILKDDAFDSLNGRERFIREFEALRAVSENPYISTLLDLTTTESGELAIVMKDMGEDVKDLSKMMNRYFSEEETSNIAIQLCFALRDLHKNGLIHRDIKPENVLISDDGGERYVNLIDLGVVRLNNEMPKSLKLEDSQEILKLHDTGEYQQPPLTQEDTVVGSLIYLDPETVVPDGKKADVMSDLYALGTMLYSMHSGSLPFPISVRQPFDPNKYIEERVYSEAQPLHERLNKAEPSLFDQIITQLLKRDPEERKTLIFNGEEIKLDSAYHVAEALKMAAVLEDPSLRVKYPYVLV